MAWKTDNPLYSLTDEEENKKTLEMWETETHGGLTEGNNRLPKPMVYLMGLIILTAFMITMPIWGQRPIANDYVGYLKYMDSPEVQNLATPEEKIAYVANKAYAEADSRTQAALSRHPITWDDLLNIAPDIKEVQSSGRYPLTYYTVLGDRLVLANFEGKWIGEGAGKYRERLQPWWDVGYTIDVFYVSYFVIAMVIVIKRLPHFSRKPNLPNIGS